MRPQLVNVEFRCVDDHVGKIADKVELLALRADGRGDGRALAQRMRTPRLAEAPHERFIRGFEENYLRVDGLLHLLQNLRQSRERLSFANIDYQSRALNFRRLSRQIGKAWNEFQRKVIDAVVAQVLECFQNRSLARAAHACNDHQLGRTALELASAWREPPTRSLLLLSVLHLFRSSRHEQMLAGA